MPSYVTTIITLLIMIVGYHFAVPAGVLLALELVIVLVFMRALRQHDHAERGKLRRMAEQGELLQAF